jgi:NAD(P)-dependent dehydrogenase (short-subunit alcohol dehydrogenase family)
MADLFSMKNRVVLLTGASRGLGRDMALTLAAAGATVLCAGRTVKELETTARAITRKGGKAHVVPLDITDEAAVREQVATLIRRHRRLDVLVNNAGIIYREAIVDTSTATFRSAIETDLVSQFMLAREVGRHMLARKYGRIVNISSIMGIVGRASVAGYVAAKHGLIGLTKNLAAEYGPHVTANAIAPGYIRTELNIPLQQNKDFNAMLERRTAAHRWGKPEDLRGPLLLLASDAGAYMTGHTLVVDGGMTTITNLFPPQRSWGGARAAGGGVMVSSVQRMTPPALRATSPLHGEE